MRGEDGACSSLACTLPCSRPLPSSPAAPCSHSQPPQRALQRRHSPSSPRINSYTSFTTSRTRTADTLRAATHALGLAPLASCRRVDDHHVRCFAWRYSLALLSSPCFALRSRRMRLLSQSTLHSRSASQAILLRNRVRQHSTLSDRLLSAGRVRPAAKERIERPHCRLLATLLLPGRSSSPSTRHRLLLSRLITPLRCAPLAARCPPRAPSSLRPVLLLPHLPRQQRFSSLLLFSFGTLVDSAWQRHHLAASRYHCVGVGKRLGRRPAAGRWAWPPGRSPLLDIMVCPDSKQRLRIDNG